jgi:purine catabolism regulator
MPLLTVRETLDAALAPLVGTVAVVAGAAGLVGEVAWAVTARPSPPLFPVLKGGELALAAATALARLDPPPSLAQLIAGLAERDAAGLILHGPISPAAAAPARAAADAAGLPLILLPPASNLADVERAITTLVHERRDELYARTTALHDLQGHLAELAGTGRTIHAIADGLARLTGHPAGVAGPAGAPELVHLSPPPGPGPDPRPFLRRAWAVLAPRIAASFPTPTGFPQSLQATEPLVSEWPLTETDLPTPAAQPPTANPHLLVAPVVVRDQVAATLVLLVPGPAGGLDQTTLARGAGIAALELARDRLARRTRPADAPPDDGPFVRALLNGEGGAEEDLRAAAQALGVPISRGYAVAVVAPAAAGRGSPAPPPRALEELARSGGAGTGAGDGALWRLVEGQLVILWPLDSAAPAERDRTVPPPDRLREVAAEARAEVARRTGGPATAGLGQGYAGLSGLARSMHEAEQAVALGSRLFGGGAVWSYAELGIYRLLLPLRAQHAGELRAFVADTLGPLASDRRAGATVLLDTLDTYLAHGGNTSQAAAALSLHRNTLAYRLHRIGAITGLDVDDPEARLRLHLALKVRRLL